MGKVNRPPRSSNRQDTGEIPEILRDGPTVASPSRGGAVYVWLMGVAGALLLGLGSLWWFQSRPVPVVQSTPSPQASPPPEKIDNILGHLPYAEAPAQELKVIRADGQLRLRRTAAVQFLSMQAAARASGVNLVPLSAFRSIEEQNRLFFTVKQQRNQATRKRAEVSAPPGYSEHHTGYALDIGDGNVPATNLLVTFEKTPAFRWLQANAARYSFELSFAPNNPQGVSYEPWHWRYVGDRQSLETFYKARNLPKAQ
ncbi:M15 family metallopeptidase [Synechocystis sp. LKSZ1]|uniref:M15 family metallopeptidase n=1 Tax=Synechocystis sp. LKSZ1 TaxID=3144951 RepID=UPI00336BB45D